jgi:hypothetical protein
MPDYIVLLMPWLWILLFAGVVIYFVSQLQKQRNRFSGPGGASYGEMLAKFLEQQERLIGQQDRLNQTLEAVVGAQEARIARLEAQLATR